VIPRDALLLAGENSVVYVETEAGRFELRRVVVGRVSGGEVEIREGLVRASWWRCGGTF
jgi:Cu(I)/Ag(I) efflux system membrane fusion protein